MEARLYNGRHEHSWLVRDTLENSQTPGPLPCPMSGRWHCACLSGWHTHAAAPVRCPEPVGTADWGQHGRGQEPTPLCEGGRASPATTTTQQERTASHLCHELLHGHDRCCSVRNEEFNVVSWHNAATKAATAAASRPDSVHWSPPDVKESVQQEQVQTVLQKLCQ